MPPLDDQNGGLGGVDAAIEAIVEGVASKEDIDLLVKKGISITFPIYKHEGAKTLRPTG